MKTERTVSGLEDHLGYWLRFVSNAVSQQFAARVESRGVSVSEWVLLRELYGQDGVAPSTLSESMGMTRGAISKLVSGLLDRKLVSRAVDRTDRRHHSLALTAKGRALVPVLARLADENDAAFFGHLSAPERAALAATLQALVRVHQLKHIPVD